MKIDGSGRIVSPATSKVSRAGGNGSAANFSHLVAGSGEAAPARHVVAPQALPGIDARLGLQEIADVTDRRARAKKRATGLLDQLDDIRNGLLMGEMPPHQLTALRDRIAREKVDVDDPKLTALMEEIELRAEVELAKLEAARDEIG